jgi:hypothetical protein
LVEAAGKKEWVLNVLQTLLLQAKRSLLSRGGKETIMK